MKRRVRLGLGCAISEILKGIKRDTKRVINHSILRCFSPMTINKSNRQSRLVRNFASAHGETNEKKVF
jgi:hypothetical protein